MFQMNGVSPSIIIISTIIETGRPKQNHDMHKNVAGCNILWASVHAVFLHRILSLEIRHYLKKNQNTQQWAILYQFTNSFVFWLLYVAGKYPEIRVGSERELMHISLDWGLFPLWYQVYSFKGLFCHLFPQLEIFCASGSFPWLCTW